MLYHTRFRCTAFAVACVFILTSLDASARALRLDSGDWDVSGLLTATTTQSLGFGADLLGVTNSSVTISADGSVSMSGGAETLSLFPFFDPNQSGGGNTASYQYGTTNGNFNQAGIDSGFRATWFVNDSTGALLNEFQFSLFNMSDGSLAMEFNYGRLLFGDDSSQIGYSSSADGDFDLTGSLGLSYADYMGVGDDDSTANCEDGDDTLACNNYYFNTGAFGAANSILPNLLGGYFRQIDTNGGAAQGRYLFLFAATPPMTGVPEPATLWLFVLGAVGLMRFRKR